MASKAELEIKLTTTPQQPPPGPALGPAPAPPPHTGPPQPPPGTGPAQPPPPPGQPPGPVQPPPAPPPGPVPGPAPPPGPGPTPTPPPGQPPGPAQPPAQPAGGSPPPPAKPGASPPGGSTGDPLFDLLSVIGDDVSIIAAHLEKLNQTADAAMRAWLMTPQPPAQPAQQPAGPGSVGGGGGGGRGGSQTQRPPATGFVTPQARQALAAAGPGGAAAVAGLELIDATDRALTGIIDTAGRAGRTIGAIDVEGVADGFQDLAKKIPVVGNLFDALGSAARNLFQGFDESAARYRNFSPELAVASAQVDVNRILRQLDQAQQMGPGLAQYVEKRDEITGRIEATLTRMAAAILPFVNQLLDAISWLMDQWNTFSTMLAQQLQNFATANQNSWNWFNQGMGQLAGNTAAILRFLQFANQQQPNAAQLEELLRELLDPANAPNIGPLAGGGVFQPNFPAVAGVP